MKKLINCSAISRQLSLFPSDLEGLKAYVSKVRQAMDPSGEAGGRESRGGIIKAAEMTLISLKRGQNRWGFSEWGRVFGASRDSELAASVRHIAELARLIVINCDRVLAAETIREAAPPARAIETLTRRIANGYCPKGGGSPTRRKGRGLFPRLSAGPVQLLAS